MRKVNFKKGGQFLFLTVLILPSFSVFLTIILLLLNTGIKTFLPLKKASLLPMTTLKPAILLGAVVDNGPGFDTCDNNRFVFGSTCPAGDCQGLPDYTVSWSYSDSNGFKSQRPSDCRANNNQPSYTFEHVLGDTPQSDNGGREIIVKINMDTNILLRAWSLVVTDQSNNELLEARQADYFENPGPNQTFRVKVYSSNQYNLNHLWFYTNSPITPIVNCGLGLDLFFVQDDTGSMSDDIQNVKNQLNSILNAIVDLSGNDYRLGLMTFKDNVTLREPLTQNNLNSIRNKINSLKATAGMYWPEASDIALRKAVNESNWRPAANKVIILNTDAPPGGLNDRADPEDYQNGRLGAREAAAKGIKIVSILSYDPGNTEETKTLMKYYANTTGGIYLLQQNSSEDMAEKILALLRICQPLPATPTPTPCPPDIPFQQTDRNQINTYCTATTKACSSPNSWASPLTCHAAPGWKPYGADCHGPYCDGCVCLSPTPTPYWKDCSYCDTNGDGKVCIDDIKNLESSFGKVNLDSDWNSSCPLCAKPESSTCDDCDMNRDGVINIFDLVRCTGACYNKCGVVLPTPTLTPTKIPSPTPTPTPRGLTCRFVTKWGNPGSSPGQFYQPSGLALSTENNRTYLYVTDLYGIDKFDTQGNFIMTIGQNQRIYQPAGIAIDPNNQYLYVVDKIGSKVFVYSVTGNFQRKFGQEGWRQGEYDQPEGIMISQSGVYIADVINGRLQKVTTYGNFKAEYELPDYPYGLSLYNYKTSSNGDDDFYMTGIRSHSVQRYQFKTSQNSFSLINTIGFQGSGDLQFNTPRAVAVDKLSGVVFVTDTMNDRIQAIDPNGRFYGKWGISGDQNLQFNHPSGIAVNNQGGIFEVFIADTMNDRIQKLSCTD